jgi:hypothetical protein
MLDRRSVTQPKLRAAHHHIGGNPLSYHFVNDGHSNEAGHQLAAEAQSLRHLRLRWKMSTLAQVRGHSADDETIFITCVSMGLCQRW